MWNIKFCRKIWIKRKARFTARLFAIKRMPMRRLDDAHKYGNKYLITPYTIRNGLFLVQNNL